jgi:hypothetical protein
MMRAGIVDVPSLWKHHTGRDKRGTEPFMSILILIEYDAGLCRNGLYCEPSFFAICQRLPLQRCSGSKIELAIVMLRVSPQWQAAQFARWCLQNYSAAMKAFRQVSHEGKRHRLKTRLRPIRSPCRTHIATAVRAIVHDIARRISGPADRSFARSLEDQESFVPRPVSPACSQSAQAGPLQSARAHHCRMQADP